jgi:hypothetical protein
VLFFDKEESYYFNYKGDDDNLISFLKSEESIKSSQVVHNKSSDFNFKIKDNSFSKNTLFTIDEFQKFKCLSLGSWFVWFR